MRAGVVVIAAALAMGPAVPTVTAPLKMPGYHPVQLVFTDEGQRLVAAQDGVLVELDAATGSELGRIELSSERVPDPSARVGWGATLGSSVGEMAWAWDAGARELLGVGLVSSTGVAANGMAVWRPGGGMPIAFPAPPRGVHCTALAISPDRTRAAVSVNARTGGQCQHANAVQVFDLATQRPVTKPIEVGRPYAAAFSPDGHLLAIGSGRAHVYDLRTGVLQTAPPSNNVAAIAFQPATGRVMWRTDNREIESWRPGAAANADLGEGGAFAFSPDGKKLAIARGGDVEVLDIGRLALPVRLPLRGASGLTFSYDGRRLAAAGPSTVVVWQLEPAAATTAVPSGHFARLRRLPVPPPRPLPPIAKNGALEGRVLLAGKPVAGAEIVLTPSPREYPDAVRLRPVRTRTGADGRYRFKRLPAIDWQQRVTARGTLGGEHGVNLRTQAVRQYDFKLRPAATIVGRVLGPDRRPARGVRLFHVSDYSNPERDVAAAADGTFTIDHLNPQGTYTLNVWRRDGAVRSTKVELKPGVIRVNITLAPPDAATVIRGTVVDAAGAPVAGAHVIVDERQLGKTDATGFFAVDVQGSPRPSLRISGAKGSVRLEHVDLPLKARLRLTTKPY